MKLQEITIQPITRSDRVVYALLYLPEQPMFHPSMKSIFMSPWTAQLLVEKINAKLEGKTDVLALSRAKLDTQNVLERKPANAEMIAHLQNNSQAALRAELEMEKGYRMTVWTVTVFVADTLGQMNNPSGVTLTGSTQDLYNLSVDLSEAFQDK